MTHVSLTGQASRRVTSPSESLTYWSLPWGTDRCHDHGSRGTATGTDLAFRCVSARDSVAPRFYRMIPLLAGIAELAYFVGVGPSQERGRSDAGLLLRLPARNDWPRGSGPVVDDGGSKLMARAPVTHQCSSRVGGFRTTRAAPFRAISGLILALFVTSVSFWRNHDAVGRPWCIGFRFAGQ